MAVAGSGRGGRGRRGSAPPPSPWRLWQRRVRMALGLAGLLVALRLLVPPGRALLGGCHPALAGDAWVTALASLSALVVAWAVGGVSGWDAVRRAARVAQVGAAVLTAANLATALICR